MPFVRSREDAEFVVAAAPFVCVAPWQHSGKQWNVIPIKGDVSYSKVEQRIEWLAAFISGMYAERDRAEKGAGA